MKFVILIGMIGLTIAAISIFHTCASVDESNARIPACFPCICTTSTIHTCAGVKELSYSPPVTHSETVVLLHGLCRTSRSMSKMEKALKADGYNVININYPSRSATIEQLEKLVFNPLTPTLDTRHPVHFVTHSMGGILLLDYLQSHDIPSLGRIVMLAPPVRGSEVPDKLGDIKLYQWINGPAGNQLGTGTNSLPLRLKEPEMNLGVIAGDRSINPILSLLIPGPDDGKVSVARVRPEGAADFIRLHVTHACMMRNRQVIKQTKAFLKNGAFQKGNSK